MGGISRRRGGEVKETTYQCTANPKHKQTVCVPVKEVFCGKHDKPVLMEVVK
jgi:hypothetical protein